MVNSFYNSLDLFPSTAAPQEFFFVFFFLFFLASILLFIFFYMLLVFSCQKANHGIQFPHRLDLENRT